MSSLRHIESKYPAHHGEQIANLLSFEQQLFPTVWLISFRPVAPTTRQRSVATNSTHRRRWSQACQTGPRCGSGRPSSRASCGSARLGGLGSRRGEAAAAEAAAAATGAVGAGVGWGRGSGQRCALGRAGRLGYEQASGLGGWMEWPRGHRGGGRRSGPRAVQGNLMPCASDGHQRQALVYLAPTAHLFAVRPGVPTNGGWKVQSIDGIPCCCQGDYRVCISAEDPYP